MKEWYALKIIKGKEHQVLRQLSDVAIPSEALTQVVYERRQGHLRAKTKYLLEGYILIYLELSNQIYHNLNNMWYVQYLLKGSLSDEEVTRMKHVASLKESTIDYSGKCIKYIGAIAQMAGNIIKVDKRKGRALVAFRVADETVKRWINVTIIR